MRDYTRIDRYLDELMQDIYEQPDNDGHIRMAKDSMRLLDGLPVHSVLDVGCGTGFMKPEFESRGIHYCGLTLGVESKDISSIIFGDFSFIPKEENSFDLVYARHVLEHSPMPLLTLMEWHRVAKYFLLLIMPDPDHYGYIGRNHYHVMPLPQILWLLRRAGWKVLKTQHQDDEFRFQCLKLPRLGYEGWAEAPLDGAVLAEEQGNSSEKTED